MKSTLFTLALAAGAMASPFGLLEKRTRPLCLTDAHAQTFMNRFISILQHTDTDLGDYITTAQKIITDDFQEISDSINMLANKPLGSVTADKTAYINGAQHAPPATGIESLAVTVSNCDNIIWEWNIKGVGKATYPVKGIGLFKMLRSGRRGKNVQASELKLEFNNIAWGLDTGYGWVKQDGTLLGRPPTPAPAAEPAAEESAEGEAAPAEEEAPAAEETVAETPAVEEAPAPSTE